MNEAGLCAYGRYPVSLLHAQVHERSCATPEPYTGGAPASRLPPACDPDHRMAITNVSVFASLQRGA